MLSSQFISKKQSDNPSLNFQQLRKEGIELVQTLSGKIWTDYNLHDPGVTTLEVLCYALTELGYRTDLLKNAFDADEPATLDFIDRYFIRYDKVIPPLPLTRWDFEYFIEKNHASVLSAWFEEYPLLHPAGIVRGGYEIALLLEPDERYGNLNTDVIRISLESEDAILEVNFFDEENRRMNWKIIGQVISCSWNSDEPDNFFEFERFNCQVASTMEIVFMRRTQSERIRVNARVTLNPLKKSPRKNISIGAYRESIIQKLESPEFLDAIARTLSKEHFKARILSDIQQTLFPCRNLCEDFISLRVVNEQEVKTDIEIILDDYAPHANIMINRIYDSLDAFLFKMVHRSKRPEHRSQKNILYASNLIEEMVNVDSVKAAQIKNLNLYIDGIPTIPLTDESAFECIHLQRFSYYIPKINREKSSVTFIRSGTVENADPSPVASDFKPQQYFSDSGSAVEQFEAESSETEKGIFDRHFFESLRHYYSIRNDFPRNYRLGEGQLPENTPEKLRGRIRQFKSYLAFFEHILIGYLDRLYSFNDLLSIKQESGIRETKLERLKKELPDLDFITSQPESLYELNDPPTRKNRILDHLLARFATTLVHIPTEKSDPDKHEIILQAKGRLLRDLPVITRERGLGLPIKMQEKEIWDSDLLSGFQKRVYRLLAVINENFKHIQLSRIRGTDPGGFYLVEHILLAKREEEHIFIKRFNRDAEVLFDYMREIYAGSHSHEPYSFQLTVVLPDWYRTWRNRRNLVETVIKTELPAHILPYFLWLNKKNMREFEVLYEDWLNSLLRLQTMKPL